MAYPTAVNEEENNKENAANNPATETPQDYTARGNFAEMPQEAKVVLAVSIAEAEATQPGDLIQQAIDTKGQNLLAEESPSVVEGEAEALKREITGTNE